MKIIQNADITCVPHTEICFWYKGHHRKWGYCFDCDASGNVDVSKLMPAALINYEKCKAGQMPDVEPAEIVCEYITRRISRIGQCECGHKLSLMEFTNTCACGRDYNSCGTLLAPREQWGEETGEHWSECY